MRLARPILILLAMLITSPSLAAMIAKPVTWTLDGTYFKGMLVYDDASQAKRPGLVMVPNWTGVNDIAIAKAKRIAGRDYVILLTDMYGEKIRPKDAAEARAAVKPLYADRNLMRARMRKALEELQAQAAHAPIDRSRLAAIGFCFGGAAVLDLARSGADDTGTMPGVPKFTEEMHQDPADWQFVEIGHAVHCFTETEATAKTGNCRYDAKAAARSYRMMGDWLKESFGES
jgi:dienelactone hydrolase